MNGKVFVNRTLNLKRIKYIGLDMDHTLIRYKLEAFEALAHSLILDKLISVRGYPEAIRSIPFRFDLAIRGLVLDRKRGNLLKLSRHAAIRRSQHGTHAIPFKEQERIYRSTYIDLGDPDFMAIDTNFSISLATLFAQLVDMKDAHPELNLPEYKVISEDVLSSLDEAHRDNTLKSKVTADLGSYVILEPDLVAGLERFKKHGKKIFLLTNSDYLYTRILLDYAVQPYLKDHKSWHDLFEFVITFARKPRFFHENTQFLRVNPVDGSMSNWDQPLTPGVYQGGCAQMFTRDLALSGDQILYIGDHIYGDILRLKKDCNWRTAMVLEELDDELANNEQAEPLNHRIEELMMQKEPLEDQLTELLTQKIDLPEKSNEESIDKLMKQIQVFDHEISDLIIKKQAMYNQYWGQIMRSGNEESYLAHQVDRYACIYMPKLSDFTQLSPRQYFRSYRRPLAHEAVLGLSE